MLTEKVRFFFTNDSQPDIYLRDRRKAKTMQSIVLESRDRNTLTIVKGLLQSQIAFQDIYQKYHKGTLHFPEIENWVDDRGRSLLYKIKEKCHSLFRSSKGGAFHKKEWLLDLAIASIFHEAMKLRENVYQLEVYRPRYLEYKRRMGKSTYEKDYLPHFEKIISKAKLGVSEGMEEMGSLFQDAAAQLIDFFRENRQNPFLIRFLIESQPLLRKIYGIKKRKEIFSLMFARGAFDAYRLAAQSCLHSEHYDLSAAYFSKAFKMDPRDVNLRFFLNFSLGMKAYLLNSYPKALSSFTKLVSSEEKAKWQREYLKKAEEVCRKIFSEMEEENRLKMAKKAGRIADQLKKCYS
jgi:tetratricopeptide (TPR) repeat protein